jgi:hypothetical protein
MVDPVTIGTGLALGAGSAGAGSLFSKLTQKATPALPAIPPGLQPATTPNAKPKGPDQQKSFMSGAAVAQQAAGGPSSGGTRGKSLLGS